MSRSGTEASGLVSEEFTLGRDKLNAIGNPKKIENTENYFNSNFKKHFKMLTVRFSFQMFPCVCFNA